MPLRNQIEAIVKTMTSNAGKAPGFLYGTEKELNIMADGFTFPGVFMYALQPFDLSLKVTKAVDDSYSILLYFLDKTEFGEFTADNEAIINQQIAAAKEFIIRMSSYRPDGMKKFFKTNVGDKFRGQQIYNKYDVNSTGVCVPMTLKTMYADLMCF